MTHDTDTEKTLADTIAENIQLTDKIEQLDTTIDNQEQEIESLERQLDAAALELAEAKRKAARADLAAANATRREIEVRRKAENEAKRRAQLGERVQNLETNNKRLVDDYQHLSETAEQIRARLRAHEQAFSLLIEKIKGPDGITTEDFQEVYDALNARLDKI